MAVGIRCAYSSMEGIAPMAAIYTYLMGGIGGADQIAPADATAAILIALLHLFVCEVCHCIAPCCLAVGFGLSISRYSF
jgi:hypothetical protein